MPFSEGSIVISCHPCLVCSIFITSQSSDRRHGNEASSFRRQLQSAALNLLLCAWLGKSNCMNPLFFSALPFRVACAFCESVPAAYPRCKRHLYTFVWFCLYLRFAVVKCSRFNHVQFLCSIASEKLTLRSEEADRASRMTWNDKPDSA